MNFYTVRDRLVVEAQTPSEGFWLHEVQKEIFGLGFDVRYDVKAEHCKILIPLRKQGELSESDRAALAAHQERRA